MSNIKTYRPIHVNVESELLERLDEYKGPLTPRSKLIHEAIKCYLTSLDNTDVRKKNWFV